MFANLDGWGVDTDYEIVQRIAQQQSSEVLVTFEDQFFIRFANGQQEAGERVFGHSDWRRVDRLPTAEKQPFLLEMYREGLHSAGFPYVLTFEMIDEGGHSLHLFFGTSTNDLWLAFVNWMAYFFPDQVMKQQIAEVALRRAQLLN